VERLAGHLGKAGIPVWYDYEIDAGDRFDAAIAKQIDDCAAFVVVLTPASVGSRWVAREIGRADDVPKPIFPLLLEPCKTPIRLQGLHQESAVGAVLPSAEFLAKLRALTAGPASGLGDVTINDVISVGSFLYQAGRAVFREALASAEPHWVRVGGGSLDGADVKLDSDPVTIGAGSDSTITLPDPVAEGRPVAQLVRRAGKWVLEQLADEIGDVTVNGTVITRTMAVATGDLIRIGTLTLTLRG
jgi:hypothetical protein